MPLIAESPLEMLVQQGIEAVGACAIDPAQRPPADSPSETVAQLAGGLLVAMGYREIAEDLDLEAVALLCAAAVAGLQRIGEFEPGVHRLDSAVYALGDLLRRTAPKAG